jgi:hypothetical protein
LNTTSLGGLEHNTAGTQNEYRHFSLNQARGIIKPKLLSNIVATFVLTFVLENVAAGCVQITLLNFYTLIQTACDVLGDTDNDLLSDEQRVSNKGACTIFQSFI